MSDDLAEVKKRLGDIEWRLDHLYRIKDKRGREILFVRNDSQLELWNNRHTLNLILKDRQRGFSTFIAILILDTCFFSKNQDCAIIDITIPDAKKKLAKMKFAYDRMPKWLTSANKLTTDAKETLEWENGSSVNVGTSHRGSTSQILHISESGKISARNPDRAREIRTGALNTVAPGCFIFNESTAEGAAGDFYEDCQAAQKNARLEKRLSHLDYKFHFFGWWMGDENELEPQDIVIPAEDTKYFNKLEEELGIKIGIRKRAWYVKKQAQQKSDMTREFPSTPEEAFQAAIEGAYLNKQINHLERHKQIGIVPHDPGFPVNTGWDFGLSDTMTIWLHQHISMQHRLIGYISGTDEDVLYYWRKLKDLDYIWGNHYLPHDGNTRRIGSAQSAEVLPMTIEEILNDAGMRDTQIVPRIGQKFTAIQEVRRFLPKVYIDEANCEAGLNCLRNFKRDWNDKLGCWRDRPRHDWAMHGYDGLETLVRGISLDESVPLSAKSKSSAMPKLHSYY